MRLNRRSMKSILFNTLRLFLYGFQTDAVAAREAYNAFLGHYPYCYGYWRKYADYERTKGDKSKCEEVSASATTPSAPPQNEVQIQSCNSATSELTQSYSISSFPRGHVYLCVTYVGPN